MPASSHVHGFEDENLELVEVDSRVISHLREFSDALYHLEEEFVLYRLGVLFFILDEIPQLMQGDAVVPSVLK